MLWTDGIISEGPLVESQPLEVERERKHNKKGHRRNPSGREMENCRRLNFDHLSEFSSISSKYWEVSI
jgi:hypothetical protein